MTKTTLRILMTVCLLVATLLGAGIAYGQFCYSSGSTINYAGSCDIYGDFECAHYGGDVWCQEDSCSNLPCGSGVSRRCTTYSWACIDHFCSTGGCA